MQATFTQHSDQIIKSCNFKGIEAGWWAQCIVFPPPANPYSPAGLEALFVTSVPLHTWDF